MTIQVGTEKYTLAVFPAGDPTRVPSRYRTEPLWARDGYPSFAAVERAARQLIRRFPESRMVVSSYKWRGWYWSGDTKDDFELYWCARCGGALRPADDMWRCSQCGDEWAPEVVHPGRVT